LAYITSAETKATYAHIVMGAIGSGRFAARPAPHGVMQNVTFFSGDQRPYAIVPTQSWLNFYFRTPKKTHPDLSLDALRQTFDEATYKEKSKEYKVRLRSVDDAVRALAFMGVTGEASGGDFVAPEELQDSAGLREGAAISVVVNSYERNARARQLCI
jgi:hypothetical protein